VEFGTIFKPVRSNSWSFPIALSFGCLALPFPSLSLSLSLPLSRGVRETRNVFSLVTYPRGKAAALEYMFVLNAAVAAASK